MSENAKWDRETYFKILNKIEELKAKKQQEEEVLRELTSTIPDSTPKSPFTKIKAFLIAALIIAVALIILAGSVVIIPTILVMVMFYLLFYAVKLSIK